MKPSNKSSELSPNNVPERKERVSPFVRRFLKQVQNTVAQYALWTKKESFIVAVSGGPDSLCLLDVLFLLSQKYDFALHVAHVNYRLRGTDSDLDEECVRKRAEFYRLPLTVLHPKKTTPNNLEEKLRDIRFHFFEKLRTQENATRIALAHHQDDQAETFLLRLLRGAGMSGLSAMRPKNNTLVRPLLHMTRADILQYLKERNISYRADESNADLKFLRNRLRHELIPLLEKKYQPNIKKILADTATLLATDYALLETLATTPKNNAHIFSVKTLLTLPDATLSQTVRLLLKPSYQKKSPPKGVIDEVKKLLQSTKNKHQIMILPGLKIERKGDTVTLLNFSS